MRYLVALVVVLGGCSWSAHARCVAGYMVGGAAIAEVGLYVGAVQNECNGDCMEHKIAAGETVNQTVHHSTRQRNDIITYGSLAAVPVGAGAGYLIGEQMCKP